MPAIGTPGPGSQTHLFESQLIAPEQRQAHVDGQPLELPGVAEGSRVAEPLTPAERLGRKASETSNGGQLANGLAAEQAKTPSHSAPQSAGPGKPLVKQASAYSNNQSKPLHKRIDREEFMKDAQNFYGTGGSAEEPASKVSRLVEQLEVVSAERVAEESDGPTGPQDERRVRAVEDVGLADPARRGRPRRRCSTSSCRRPSRTAPAS